MTTETPTDGQAADALTPGRELDRRVAEALGWTGIEPGKYLYRNYLGVPPNGGEQRPVPDYSTDPGAALTALMTFNRWDIARIGSDFECVIPGLSMPGTVIQVDDDFCLAVCGAILAAKASAT